MKVRPARPGRRRAQPARPRAARSTRWRRSTTPSSYAACGTSSAASGRTSCWSSSTAPGCRRWYGATVRSRSSSTCRSAVEIASALHYLRRIGWAHLDIKPSNVIMGAPARLIDLSVARPVEDAAQHPADRHRRLHVARAVGPGPVRRTVAGLATSGAWAPRSSRRSRATARSTCPPRSRPTLPDRVPAEVAKTIAACLELRPEDRPAPREVAEALEPVLDRQPPVRLGGALRTR